MKDRRQKLLRFESQSVHGKKVLSEETYKRWSDIWYKVPEKDRTSDFLMFEPYSVKISNDGNEQTYYARGKGAHEIIRKSLHLRGDLDIRINYMG